MTTRPRLLGISGSLRKGSFCTAILRTAAEQISDRADFDILALDDVPLYNQDLDSDAPPAEAVALRDSIGNADGLLIATPEYNYGMSGVLKNALDWASRPAYKSVLKGKPVLIISNSPGALGGARAQIQLRQTLFGTLSRVVARPEIAVAHVATKLTEGRLTDEQTRSHFKEGLADLAAEVARTRS